MFVRFGKKYSKFKYKMNESDTDSITTQCLIDAADFDIYEDVDILSKWDKFILSNLDVFNEYVRYLKPFMVFGSHIMIHSIRFQFNGYTLKKRDVKKMFCLGRKKSDVPLELQLIINRKENMDQFDS